MLRQILKAACLAPLALLLCQCDALKPKAPSPYAADVTLKFTPMAAAALAQAKDNIVVLAYFYGDPKPEAKAKADNLGRLVLGSERSGWSNNTRLVHLSGKIDASLLPSIRGEPQLLVSVYSVMPDGSSDDLIACKTWIGTVKGAQARSPVIGCELETGDKDSADDLVGSASDSSGRP